MSVKVNSLPLNCSDLSECVCVPSLKNFDVSEHSMSLPELLQYQNSVLKSVPKMPFYVLRDRTMLCRLNQWMMDRTRTGKR